jgi:inhibitor of cysteine peptidase
VAVTVSPTVPSKQTLLVDCVHYYKVTITTKRPADKMCTEALVPFEESVALEVVGLPAGTYTVEVNGVTASFTLDGDNALP